MKKLVALFVAMVAVFSFGCGRNAQFGVVDLKKVETESKIYQTIRQDMMTKGQKLQSEMIEESKGKSKEEAEKILQEKSAKMQVLQSEAQNKLKNSFESAVSAVAKEKNLSAVLVKDAVPQGGVDITAEVIKKMN